MNKVSLMIASSVIITATGVQAGTLDDVIKRGTLSCGVSTGIPGFSQKDEKGNWSGIDVDSCRAVAAAVLGDAKKVRFKPLSSKERFTALQSGEIDILSRNTTWTHTRDTSLGVNFTAVNYYDGQGFMVNKNLGVNSALELDGAEFCIQTGSTTELNLSDYFSANNLQYKAVTFDTSSQARAGFESGRCDALTSDQSQLYATRIGLKNPEDAIVLPEIISKEPLGPVVRQGDDAWFNVVRWSIMAMVEAEFLGITSKNVYKAKKSGSPSQKRLMGSQGDAGKNLGVSSDWAYNIIKQVGNYGESFERNVGRDSPLKISRGLNAQWNRGGIMYSAPVR